MRYERRGGGSDKFITRSVQVMFCLLFGWFLRGGDDDGGRIDAAEREEVGNDECVTTAEVIVD
jgi:hypothetical protein